MKNYLVVVAAITLSGCAVTLSEKAAKIQVHSQMSTILTKCKVLGPVSGEGAGIYSDGEQLAKNNAREKAADLGGDTLVITNLDRSIGKLFVKDPHTVVQGSALLCY